MNKFTAKLTSASASLAFFMGAAAFAAPGGGTMQSAISQYNKGQYYAALKELSQIESKEPNNAMAHYYSALCKQCIGQTAEARTEYQWVYAHGDSRLKSLAQAGYARLGAVRSASSGSISSSAIPVSSPAVAQNFSGAAAHSAGGASTKGSGITKVIEFYTDWCGVCKEFASTFDSTRSQFPGVEFQQLNAEDAANSELVSRYGVKNYPTLVYLDGSGNVLLNRAGAPMGGDFAHSISRYYRK